MISYCPLMIVKTLNKIENPFYLIFFIMTIFYLNIYRHKYLKMDKMCQWHVTKYVYVKVSLMNIRPLVFL